MKSKTSLKDKREENEKIVSINTTEGEYNIITVEKEANTINSQKKK